MKQPEIRALLTKHFAGTENCPEDITKLPNYSKIASAIQEATAGASAQATKYKLAMDEIEKRSAFQREGVEEVRSEMQQKIDNLEAQIEDMDVNHSMVVRIEREKNSTFVSAIVNIMHSTLYGEEVKDRLAKVILQQNPQAPVTSFLKTPVEPAKTRDWA